MVNSKKILNSGHKSSTDPKKSQKHDANLQTNSTLYFQIGLILCLLGTYALFEMQFVDQKILIDTYETNDLATIDIVEKFRVERDIIPEKKEQQVRRKVLTNKIVEVPDDLILIDPANIVVTDVTPLIDKPITIDDIDVIVEPKDPVFVDFVKIEKAPIYPGCEKYIASKERKKCMSEKISRLVNRKFNTDIAAEHGLSGIQRVHTQFTIDKYGNVVDIKARAPHSALEKEAQRIIDKIPHMKPGYQRDAAVGVIYTLPISFQVRY